MGSMTAAARLRRRALRVLIRGTFGNVGRAIDGLLWLRARLLFQSSGLFATLPLTGRVLEVEGNYGHLSEMAVHHIPNRRCTVVDADRKGRYWVDRRVRRRKFDRICAMPDRLPFADASFDAAWTTFALAQLEPKMQEATLAEMVRVVRPGGVLVALERIGGTASYGILARVGDILALNAPFGRRQYRSVEGWRRVLVCNGWSVGAEHDLDRWNGRSFVCRRI